MHKSSYMLASPQLSHRKSISASLRGKSNDVNNRKPTDQNNWDVGKEAATLNQLRKELVRVCKTRSIQDPVTLVMKKYYYENIYLRNQVKQLEDEIKTLENHRKIDTKEPNSLKNIDFISNFHSSYGTTRNLLDDGGNGFPYFLRADRRGSAESIKPKLSIIAEKQPEDYDREIKQLQQSVRKLQAEKTHLEEKVEELEMALAKSLEKKIQITPFSAHQAAMVELTTNLIKEVSINSNQVVDKKLAADSTMAEESKTTNTPSSGSPEEAGTHYLNDINESFGTIHQQVTNLDERSMEEHVLLLSQLKIVHQAQLEHKTAQIEFLENELHKTQTDCQTLRKQLQAKTEECKQSKAKLTEIYKAIGVKYSKTDSPQSPVSTDKQDADL